MEQCLKYTGMNRTTVTVLLLVLLDNRSQRFRVTCSPRIIDLLEVCVWGIGICTTSQKIK
jgi:hypothetical protein